MKLQEAINKWPEKQSIYRLGNTGLTYKNWGVKRFQAISEEDALCDDWVIRPFGGSGTKFLGGG